MYNIKTDASLATNSKLLLNSDKDQLEKLFIQHNVDPSSLEDMMRTVHDWYRKEPHLPKGQLPVLRFNQYICTYGQSIDDQFIARLLIMRKFSIEKVKQKIDNYFAARHNMPELLTNRDPMDPKLNACLNLGCWVVLPQKTPENYRVTILRLKPGVDYSVVDILKVIIMIGDYRIRNDSVMGEELILDISNVTLQLAIQMTPVHISKILYYSRECLGAKVKGVHIVNLLPFTEVILTLFKKLMNPKIVKRLHFYKSFEEVLLKFPRNIFPKDLGGTDDVTCQQITDAWQETLCAAAWRNYFIEQDVIQTDEAKRSFPNNSNNYFGPAGSFKKLSID